MWRAGSLPQVSGPRSRPPSAHQAEMRDAAVPRQSALLCCASPAPAPSTPLPHVCARYPPRRPRPLPSFFLPPPDPKAELVLKAQIHAGGRGKGTFSNGFKGGGKICTTPAQVEEYASKMLGAKLVTKQTGPEGQLCSRVLVNEGINISRELYFAILMDRAYSGPVLVASTQGGMDIEEVAEKHPDAILKQPVNIKKGLSVEEARAMAVKLGFTGGQIDAASNQFRALYTMFTSTDATQVEINPLAVGSVPGGAKDVVIAVDAKLNFDDNAAFRQGVRERGGESCGPSFLQAHANSLAHVRLRSLSRLAAAAAHPSPFPSLCPARRTFTLSAIRAWRTRVTWRRRRQA